MALIGNVIHDAKAGNPSIVNYVMFVAVFSMLTLFYLIAASINEGFAVNPIIPVAVDGINVLLFFCGAVALAAQLGVHSCGRKVRLIGGFFFPCRQGCRGFSVGRSGRVFFADMTLNAELCREQWHHKWIQ